MRDETLGVGIYSEPGKRYAGEKQHFFPSDEDSCFMLFLHFLCLIDISLIMGFVCKCTAERKKREAKIIAMRLLAHSHLILQSDIILSVFFKVHPKIRSTRF